MDFNPTRTERDIIVIGGSAGSVPVLETIFSNLPKQFPAAVIVVLHQAQSHPGRLPEIITRLGGLPAQHARDGDAIELGRVYVAPPDFHLLIDRGRLKLSRGPKENRFRPAIDPLFRTAARAYGGQVIGVILSGLLDDGTLGLMRVKQFGGTTVVQDPKTTDAPDMPSSAIRNVQIDHVLPPDSIAPTLVRLVQEPSHASLGEPVMSNSQPAPELSHGVQSETGDTADRGDNALSTGHLKGPPSALTCPACGGAIWERNEEGLIMFRCHVGHAYTADSFTADHDSVLESTLWEAVRMFQESAALHRRMERKAHETGNSDMAKRFRERAHDQETRTELMRKLLLCEGDAA